MNEQMSALMEQLPGGKGVFVSLPKLLEAAGVKATSVPIYRRHLALIAATNAYIQRGTVTLDHALQILRDPGCTFPMTFPRQLWQDLTGTPAGTDFAAFKAAAADAGLDPDELDIETEVVCVVDHSGEDGGGTFLKNLKIEIAANEERYGFLKFLDRTFDKFKLVPAGKAICHQANAFHFSRGLIEYVRGVWGPDAVVGLDSHTPTVGALAVVSKGMGGVDALPQAFGGSQPFSNSPVVRVKLVGEMSAAVQATDLALIIAEQCSKLERKVAGSDKTVTGIGGCVLEIDAPHLDVEALMAAANMGPEHQAFTTFRPTTANTIAFMRSIGHDEDAERYEAYVKAQGLIDVVCEELEYEAVLTIDLADYKEPSIAAMLQPHTRYPLSQLPQVANDRLQVVGGGMAFADAAVVHDGMLGVASISSCTASTSMFQMFAAALVARNLNQRGAQPRAWVKTSFTPGSEAVIDFLTQAGLMSDMEQMGFGLTGYGCGTCIGNTGELLPIAQAAMEKGVKVKTMTASNRNFENRVFKGAAGSILANPAIVVMAAVAGSSMVDLTSEDGFALDAWGKPILLDDVMPAVDEVYEVMRSVMTPEVYRRIEADLFVGGEDWDAIPVAEGNVYPFSDKSPTLAMPPFFTLPPAGFELEGAKVLAHFYDQQGDEAAPITTDHISPVSQALKGSPAALLLAERFGVNKLPKYGRLRGHFEMMVRGTFANAALRNRLIPDGSLGQLALNPDGKVVNLFDAAMAHADTDTPLVIFGHHLYGSGSSRDWAAKGTRLLGVRSVLAEDIATIHRSNLVALGVTPIHMDKKSAHLDLDGSEVISISYPKGLGLGAKCEVFANGDLLTTGTAQIFDEDEVEMIKAGGVCPLFLRRTIEAMAA